MAYEKNGAANGHGHGAVANGHAAAAAAPACGGTGAGGGDAAFAGKGGKRVRFEVIDAPETWVRAVEDGGGGGGGASLVERGRPRWNSPKGETRTEGKGEGY